MGSIPTLNKYLYGLQVVPLVLGEAAPAVATAAAELPSSTDPVPAVLEDATPADVLMYLYDVVLKAYMNRDTNAQGLTSTKWCPGGMLTFEDGRCAPPSSQDYIVDSDAWFKTDY